MTLAEDLAAFRFCPRCGAAGLSLADDKAIRCEACAFRYFHNTATAVAVVLVVDDAVLLTERAHPPAAGLFDFPGGFTEPGESMERAASRELAEELGLVLAEAELRYLLSVPNRYPFDGTVYRVCDAYFTLRLPRRPTLRPADDVADAQWHRPDAVPRSRVAFDSVQFVLEALAAGALDRA